MVAFGQNSQLRLFLKYVPQTGPCDALDGHGEQLFQQRNFVSGSKVAPLLFSFLKEVISWDCKLAKHYTCTCIIMMLSYLCNFHEAREIRQQVISFEGVVEALLPLLPVLTVGKLDAVCAS